MPNRWTLDAEDGSMFHEVVVLPTVAPQLARPENLPATQNRAPAINPPAGALDTERPVPHRLQTPSAGNRMISADTESQTVVDRNTVVDASVPAVSTNTPRHAPILTRGTVANNLQQGVVTRDLDDTSTVIDPEAVAAAVTPSRLFHLTAEMLYTQPPQGPRGKPVRKHKPKPGPMLPILEMDRREVIQQCLTLHDLQHSYQPGASGFSIWPSWTGSAGGKTHASEVCFDADWVNIISQLKLTKASVTGILVVFDIDLMEGFRTRGPMIQPNVTHWSAELSYGTQVPHQAMYPENDRLRGQYMMDIKHAHEHKEHGPEGCYRSGGVCYPLNKFKTKGWADAIIAKEATMDEPPEGLFKPDDARRPETVKWRGRSGPYPSSSDRPSSPVATSSDSAAFRLLENILPYVLKRPASALEVSPPSTPRHRRTYGPSSPLHLRSTPSTPTRPRRDDPVPPSPSRLPKEELKACLDAYGKAKSLDAGTVDTAFKGLSDVKYTVDLIDEIPVARLMELTSLDEGIAAGLRKFGREWSGRVEIKRARLFR